MFGKKVGKVRSESIKSLVLIGGGVHAGKNLLSLCSCGECELDVQVNSFRSNECPVEFLSIVGCHEKQYVFG